MRLLHKKLDATRRGSKYNPNQVLQQWARGVTEIQFWVDGGMLGGRNPSTVGVFWSVYRSAPQMRGTIVVHRKESRKHFTNNDAEWLALREALHFAREYHKTANIHIHSDSQLVVNQFNKQWACNVPRLRILATQCWELAADLPGCCVVVSWCSRSEMLKRLGH